MKTFNVARPKVENIQISAIKNLFDVRVKLDEDRVIQFAGLYEGGAPLPPIEVVKLEEGEYAFIDGRTRAAARQYLNLKDVPAVVFNGNLKDNPIELFARALEANWGGAKPPTREDIVHSILRMLEAGATHTAIKERLDFLPRGTARTYIQWANSVLNRRKLSKALDAIADGVSIDTAAKSYKLKPDTLRDVVAGKKGKWGAGRSEEKHTSVETKNYISRQLQAANVGIGKKLFHIFEKVENGEFSLKEAESILHAYAEHVRKTQIRIDDWKARFAAISGEQDKAVGVAAE